MENFRKLGGNQYMMKVLLTDMELEKLELVNNASDWVPRVHFWAKKYNETTGVDHLNSLVNFNLKAFLLLNASQEFFFIYTK